MIRIAIVGALLCCGCGIAPDPSSPEDPALDPSPSPSPSPSVRGAGFFSVGGSGSTYSGSYDAGALVDDAGLDAGAPPADVDAGASPDADAGAPDASTWADTHGKAEPPPPGPKQPAPDAGEADAGEADDAGSP